MERAYDVRHAGMPHRRPVAARAAALTALLASIVMFAAVLLDGADRAPAAAGSIEPQMQRLSAAFGELARALESLKPGRSGATARRKVHAAVDAVAAVRGDVRELRASGALGESMRLDNALGAAYEYLDAVGSLLSNPRSLLRRRLPRRALRAKAAFNALPDPAGLPATVRGWQQLEDFAAHRRRR